MLAEGWPTFFLIFFAALPVWEGDALADLPQKEPKERTLVLGVRADAPPFSYRRGDGSPDGYSVELCNRIRQRAIADGLYDHFDYVWITPADRFTRLLNREVDLLCESTTVTLERMRYVDFSVFTFVSGASFLYPARYGDLSLDDLSSRAVTVAESTTTAAFVEKNLPNAKIIPVSKAQDGIDLLANGQATAHFGDREVLQTLRNNAETGDPPIRLNVSAGFLTFEPYALAVRPDPADTPCRERNRLLFLVNETLTSLIADDEISKIFRNYFPRQQMSGTLEEMIRLQAIPTGTKVQNVCEY